MTRNTVTLLYKIVTNFAEKNGLWRNEENQDVLDAEINSKNGLEKVFFEILKNCLKIATKTVFIFQNFSKIFKNFVFSLKIRGAHKFRATDPYEVSIASYGSVD